MKDISEGAKRRAESRVPDFSSYEDEAAFWDTHDFTEH